MDFEFLCEKKLALEEPKLHRIYKDAVIVLQKILTFYQPVFPSYTDHSSLHSMHVIDLCNKLIGENIGKMTPAENFVLLMACYLHDVGMGIPVDDVKCYFDVLGLDCDCDTVAVKENVRKYHNEISSLFVIKHKDFFDFPDDEMAVAVAKVVKGHRKVDLFDEEDYPGIIRSEKYGDIRLPYLASLIRLADEIDIAADRIPEMLVDYDLVALDKKCVREYEKHHAVRQLIIESDRMVMKVKTDNEELFGEIVELRDKVKETLDYCKKVIETRTPFSLSQKTIEIERLEIKEATVFDTDLGIDDAVAFLLWKNNTVKPDFIVCTPGNAGPEDIRLTSRLLKKISGLGSELVINDSPVKAVFPLSKNSFHGSDGLGNMSGQIAAEYGLGEEKSGDFLTLDQMCEKLRGFDEITYICVGPLTGIMKADSFEGIHDKIRNAYIMGGGLHEFNCDNDTEFNFSKYPEGVEYILKSGLPITLFPLDLTNHQTISAEEIEEFDKIGSFPSLAALLKYNYSSNTALDGIDGAVMHDSMPVLYTKYPERFTVEDKKIACDKNGAIFESENGTEMKVAVYADRQMLVGEIRGLFEPSASEKDS